jgi:cell division protein FtsN
VGLSMSVCVLIWQNYRDNTAARTASEVPKPEPRPDKDTGAGEARDNTKNYDFYDMLPNFEVVVPEKDREVSRERDNAPAKIERRAVRAAGRFVSQAGRSRPHPRATQAAGHRRERATRGVDEDVWHRVRIGPITDLAELNRLRARLRAADLDALVIRVGE